MERAHTEGPWQIYGKVKRGPWQGHEIRVKDMEKDECAIALTFGLDSEECIANAHMVSAAPELYKALEAMHKAVGDLMDELGSGPASGATGWRAIDDAMSMAVKARKQALGVN